MDRIATWTKKERETLFLDSAETLPHLRPSLIEKDFWVCWLLRRLFLLDQEVPMIFKGGTSISKAYRIIRRFSEDIDLSLDREVLGYGDVELDAASSKKAFKKLLEELRTTCNEYITGPLLEALTSDIGNVLGASRSGDDLVWELTPSVDRESLVFTYPQTAVTLRRGEYVAPAVRLEFGARADHWPAEDRPVSAYAAEAFPDVFEVSTFSVWTLKVGRTFWEKATILHALANGGPEKVTPRMARHYYDLVLLADAKESSHSVDDTALLKEVALHKARFFPASWASYETARVGSLRLAPPPDLREIIEKDYNDMAELFMDEPPSFARLVERLGDLESSING
jgi:hypothetical protein